MMKLKIPEFLYRFQQKCLEYSSVHQPQFVYLYYRNFGNHRVFVAGVQKRVHYSTFSTNFFVYS